MTKETLEKANALAKQIEDLKDTYDSLKSSNYQEWHLRGIWDDGVEDYVAVFDEEIIEQIRKTYEIKIARAENIFRNL